MDHLFYNIPVTICLTLLLTEYFGKFRSWCVALKVFAVFIQTLVFLLRFRRGNTPSIFCQLKFCFQYLIFQSTLSLVLSRELPTISIYMAALCCITSSNLFFCCCFQILYLYTAEINHFWRLVYSIAIATLLASLCDPHSFIPALALRHMFNMWLKKATLIACEMSSHLHHSSIL